MKKLVNIFADFFVRLSTQRISSILMINFLFRIIIIQNQIRLCRGEKLNGLGWVYYAKTRLNKQDYKMLKKGFEYSLMSLGAKWEYKKRNPGKYFPISQYWVITRECNRKCPGCKCSSARDESTMTIDDWERLGIEAIKNGTMVIFISGGEPMNKKDMIIELKKRLGMKVAFVVFTCGDFVTKEDLIEFNKLGILLAVSYASGMKDDTQAEKVIQWAKELNCLIGTAITITEENFKLISSRDFIDDLINNKHVLFSFFLHYIPLGDAKADRRFYLRDYSEVEKFLTEDGGIKDEPAASLSYASCGVGKNTVPVMDNGDVIPCFSCACGKTILGNVKNQSLEDIFSSDLMSEIRQKNHNNTCFYINNSPFLFEKGFITKEQVESLEEANYPKGYRRKFNLWPRFYKFFYHKIFELVNFN